MEFNTEKTLFLGIDKEGDLICLELNFNDLNKGTKFYNPHYYITPHGYTEIKDEETGEQEARERLEDSEYWEDLGYLNQSPNNYNPVLDFIDFESLADHVINNDGWQMTNGEFYYLGTFQDKTYYINLNWIGRDKKELFNKKNYKNIFISDLDFAFLSNCNEVKQGDKKEDELKKIFSKYQDTKEIISLFLDEQENKG